MDTHKKIREHISALCDGELASADLELAMAALQSLDGQQAWETYHRIGDVLRAQASAELSDTFSSRLAARLAGEPAPPKRAARQGGTEPALGRRSAARLADAGNKSCAHAGNGALAQGGNEAGGSPDDQPARADAKAVVRPKPAIASVR
jgi:sigma-E factor negative regulatory protein RseA